MSDSIVSCIIPARFMPMAINIGIHVMILFCILTCLFYFLFSKVETQTISGELQNNINGIVTNINNNPAIYAYLHGPQQELVAEKLKQLYSTPDPVVTTNNNWLLTTTIIGNVSIFLIILVVVLVLILNCKECIPIGKIIAENAGTFALVGVIEVLFFLNVAIKYTPVHPDVVTTSFLNELKSKLSQ